MSKDPLVEGIHRVRSAIAARFDNDLEAICQNARKRQAASRAATVTLPPRRPRHPATKTKVG